MTLDREAALALFGNAAPMPATAGGAPFSSSPPFSPVGNDALTARMSGVSTRKGPDWRLVAPIGIAALCAGAVLVITAQGDNARPGKSVAATPAPRPVAMAATARPVEPAPIEATPVAPPPLVVETPAARPAPEIRARSAEPARRASPARRAEVAPTPPADTSVHEPYVPPPAPVATPVEPTTPPVIVAPAAPPPIVAPEPTPMAPTVTPDPTTPPQ